MTATVRDAWSDARLVATQEVLDDEVAAVRRKAWIREVLVLVLELGLLVGAVLAVEALVDSSSDGLWRPTRTVLHASSGLEGLGLVLVLISSVTTSRAGAGSFLWPDRLLARSDRRWLRAQIVSGTPVPQDAVTSWPTPHAGWWPTLRPCRSTWA